ncbi:E3 ubiquitin/ISG15 ligase TRIM25-like [Mantella aurantiaca]
MAFSDARKELDCSICLNIYTDPVTLRCGHNFCWDCIDGVLDTQERSGVYFCPECREVFEERPDIHRNVMEDLDSEPEPEESQTSCSYCIHSPVPAVKSCLHCEASLCDNHLKVHSKSSQHVLSDLTAPLESKKCSVHEKTLEYYCTEDSACLCGSCRLHGEHQDHQVDTMEEASKGRKENLSATLQTLSKKREKMKQSIESLQKYKRKVQGSSAGVTKRVKDLFRDIRRQLDTLEKKVLNKISCHAENVSFPVSDFIQELEMQKDELSRKIRHMEEICNMTDPLTVLQESDAGNLCDTEDGSQEDTERRDKLLRGGGDLDVTGILCTLHTGLSDLIAGVNRGLNIPEAADLLLDAETANNYLQISDDKKTAHKVVTYLNLPNTPKRFKVDSGRTEVIPQVLSSQSFFSGRHYWDVDVGGSSYWRVGVCYTSMYRTGTWSEIGNNSESWCLQSRCNQLSAKTGNSTSTLPGKFFITRVRINLDYEAGQISFYELGIPIRHLHTFTSTSNFTSPLGSATTSSSTFREPLHAAFYIGEGCIKICRGNLEV